MDGRPRMRFHGNMTIEEWWMDWFGLWGREIGSDTPFPVTKRKYSNNPHELITDIAYCEAHEIPIWITAQPFSGYGVPMGIEKIFLDFDDDGKYCEGCDEWYTKKDIKHVEKRSKKDKTLICKKHRFKLIVKPRKDVIIKNVILMIKKCIIPQKLTPLIVETYKGYHVYIFITKIWSFNKSHETIAGKIYTELVKSILLQGKVFKFLDDSCIQIRRMARVPLSIHQKSGLRCRIVELKNERLVETKVRSVALYRSGGLKESHIQQAIDNVKRKLAKKAQREMELLEEGIHDFSTIKPNGGSFHDIIRPCFQTRADIGEMTHAMRLAFLTEAYFNGYKGTTDEESEEKLTDLFSEFSDFVESKTRYFVRYFLKHEPDVYPPYRCETLMEKGYCIEDECFIYKKRKHL